MRSVKLISSAIALSFVCATPVLATKMRYTDQQVIDAIEVKLIEIDAWQGDLKASLETANRREARGIRQKLRILRVRERRLNYFEHKVPYMTKHQIHWLISHYHLDANVSPEQVHG